MNKKIGISQRVDSVEFYNESRDALDQRLINWVTSCNFIPVPIPNNLINVNSSQCLESGIDDWLNVVGVDAILLSGGNSIGDIDCRDLTERYLLSWAEKNKKPVLGLCRGMQMLGFYAGVELVSVDKHVRVHHQLKLKNPHTVRLPELVNSYHDFALESCPNGFEVLAESKDGCIEAIKHERLPWEGWMWHPERESPFNSIDKIRFRELVNNVRK